MLFDLMFTFAIQARNYCPFITEFTRSSSLVGVAYWWLYDGSESEAWPSGEKL